MVNLPVNYLFDNGLIFEMNRTLLHPLGLALSIKTDPNIVDGPNQVLVLSKTDDREGFLYNSEDFMSGAAKFSKFMKISGESTILSRHSALGYIRQTRSDQ